MNKWLSLDEYLNILKENENAVDISDTPPVKPNPGDLYLYSSVNKPYDWNSDQYRWRYKGTTFSPRNSPNILCKYYHPDKGTGFQKRAYMLPNKENGIIVIHYVGSMENVIHTAHGNRKSKRHLLHKKTAKSVLETAKSDLLKAPRRIYQNLLSAECHPDLTPVLQPRDTKQIQNVLQRERRKKLKSNDDILGIYQLDDELSGYISNMRLLPNFMVILCDPLSLDNLKKANSLSPCTLHYDTTFNLGDFYLSVITYRNQFFTTTRGSEPVVPVFYMIHDTKTASVHVEFFEHVKKIYNEIDGLPIITDREKAITIAIRQVLPKSLHVYCWNHIRQDVKYWIKKQANHRASDVRFYTDCTWDLLDSCSEKEFQKKYETMKKHWSKRFLDYFEKHLLNDVKENGKWLLKSHNLYTPRSGVTINGAESFNRFLKRAKKCQNEMSAQAMVLSLYQFDLFFNLEIARGFRFQGDYTLKSEYVAVYADEKTSLPKLNLSLEQLPYIFINEDFLVKQSHENEKSHSNFALAKNLILDRRITLVPERQAFFIEGAKEDYAVRLYPKESCSCKCKKNCFHILAAHLSIGNKKSKQQTLKLSVLMKKKRGYRSGRKKDPQNIKVVEDPEDSTLRSENGKDSSSNLLLPTINSQDSSVKRRFIAVKTKRKTADGSSIVELSQSTRFAGEILYLIILKISNIQLGINKSLFSGIDSSSSDSTIAPSAKRIRTFYREKSTTDKDHTNCVRPSGNRNS